MSEDVNVRNLLASFDAKLPATQAREGFQDLPLGLHHGVLDEIRVNVKERDGRYVPYALFVFGVLSSAGRGEALKGKRHFEFVGLDPENERDAAKYKTLVSQMGLSKEYQNSVAALTEAFDDKEAFAEATGVPLVEFKMVRGKRKNEAGDYKTFFNIQRTIDADEIGVFDIDEDEILPEEGDTNPKEAAPVSGTAEMQLSS